MPDTEDQLSLVGHLSELRKRIIWVMVVLVISLLGGLAAAEPIILYLKGVEPASNLEWHLFSPWDSVRIYMQFAFAASLILTLPVALYHVWAFVKPALRVQEQKAALRFIPAAFFLLLLGMAFAYFLVFPMAFFFTNLISNRLDLTQTYGVAQYFSFMFNIIIPISLLFELPLVVMFLTAIRLLNPARLYRFRRYAYVILFITGALVTPPDVVSAVIVSIPLIILYEISVVLSRVIYRKQIKQKQEWEEEYGER